MVGMENVICFCQISKSCSSCLIFLNALHSKNISPLPLQEIPFCHLNGQRKPWGDQKVAIQGEQPRVAPVS